MLIDQIPNLIHLQRFLEELVVSQPPAYKSELIIEQVPEIYDGLLRKYKGKWKEIAVNQSKTVLDPSEAEIREKAKRYKKQSKSDKKARFKQKLLLRWTDTFNSDVLESLINEPAKCAECGQPAPKRCSRCKNEWYCRR